MKNRWIIKFSHDDLFSSYCKTISETFCPYLKPSEQKQVLYATRYKLNGDTIDDIQENIFYYGVLHTELLRQERKNQIDKRKKLLICENVLFDIPKDFDHHAEQLLSWAHWMLKQLYSQVGIMIGKFWTYEQIPSRKGEDIPPPPDHFLSIRSAIKSSDPYFFESDDLLLEELLHSEDKDQNVHAALLPSSCDIHNLSSMKKHEYYQIVYNWAKL